MRKFIIIICILSLVAIPVSADSFTLNDLYIDLLDYGPSSSTGSNYFYFAGLTNRYMKYDLPNRLNLSTFDILFTNDTGQSVSVSIYNENNSFIGNLKVVNVTGKLYRAYGNLTASNYFAVSARFMVPIASNGSCSIESFRVGRSDSYTALTGEFGVSCLGQTVKNTWIESDPSTYSILIPYNPQFPTDEDAIVEIYFGSDDYIQYDYLYFLVGFAGFGISAIDCTTNDEYVPVTYSFASNGSHYSYMQLSILVDLTQINRDHDDNVDLFLHISGSKPIPSQSYAYMLQAEGIVGLQTVSSTDSWLTKIYNRIGELLNGDSLDQGAADSFGESSFEQSNELAEMSAVMNAVEQPDLSAVNMSVGAMVDPSVVTLTTSGISSALSNDILIRVLIMAITLAVAGFILYGKK